MQEVDKVGHSRLFIVGHGPEARGKEFVNGAEAEVVRATFKEGDFKFVAIRSEDRKGARDIGGNELGLEVTGSGRDDDGSVVSISPKDSGD